MNTNDALRAYIDLSSYLSIANHGTWKRAAHLDLLCDALHKIEAGTITRLIVNMPPRHGKSEVISKGFPSWYLGRHPDHEIMLTSYGAELSEDFSRINREKLREFGEEIFGIRISKASASVGRWGISGHRGGLVAAGVNGPLTGRGANVAIIDDPIKGALEANSTTYRQHLLEWYQTVLRTRLAPGGAIIVVQTRWAKDDLAGWLIEQSQTGGEQWTILNMPAISGDEPDSLERPPGQALWPERFSVDYLRSVQATLTPHQWTALYQQRPSPIGGGMWKYQDIDNHRVSKHPELVEIVVGIDPAVTSSDDADETGIVIVGRGTDKHLYVIGDHSLRGTPSEWGHTAIYAYHLTEADRIVAEVNNGGEVIESLLRNIDPSIPYKAVRASRGKQIRAEPVAALYEQGLVHHVGTYPILEGQMCEWIPGEKSPDRMDALVWAVTELTENAKKALLKPVFMSGGGNSW